MTRRMSQRAQAQEIYREMVAGEVAERRAAQAGAPSNVKKRAKRKPRVKAGKLMFAFVSLLDLAHGRRLWSLLVLCAHAICHLNGLFSLASDWRR